MVQKNNIAWAVFLLRFGLGSFWVLWSLDKIIAPEVSVAMFAQFYWVEINTSVAMLLGAIQLVLSLFLLLGMYKTATYGLALFIHTFSSILIFWHLSSPFGENHSFIANLPIFFSFLTLFLLRELDSKLILSKKKTIFT